MQSVLEDLKPQSTSRRKITRAKIASESVKFKPHYCIKSSNKKNWSVKYMHIKHSYYMKSGRKDEIGRHRRLSSSFIQPFLRPKRLNPSRSCAAVRKPQSFCVICQNRKYTLIEQYWYFSFENIQRMVRDKQEAKARA